MTESRSYKGWTLVAILSMFAGCSNPSADKSLSAGEALTPRHGGMIRYSIFNEPVSLDTMATSNVQAGDITSNIYEGLFAMDSQFHPQPSLAESYRMEDGGLRWVISLRKGVRFHNGEEMTSADVHASLKRWLAVAEPGHLLSRNLANLEIQDPHTLVFRLKKPMSMLPTLLTLLPGRASIHPKSLIGPTGGEALKTYIGTGPYQFKAWKPGQYIELTRFDAYKSRPEPSDGMAGQRTAYADSVRFIPMTAVQQRVQGVQTGAYDIADYISPDLFSQVSAMPSIEPIVVEPYTSAVVVFNKKLGLFTNQKMRQAVQAAADHEPMMQAAFGDPVFYELDPSLSFKDTPWWSDASKALYNQKNSDKAKQLMREAGYEGQLVRILVTTNDWPPKLAAVLQSQLEAVGMRVTVDQADSASVLQRRKNPALFEMFITFASYKGVDPSMYIGWDAGYPGWWVNPRKDTVVEQLSTEPDASRRRALFADLQELFYQDVPMLRIGNFGELRIKRKNVHGPGLDQPYRYLFNSWLSEN